MNSQQRYSLSAKFYDSLILGFFGYEIAADYFVEQLPFGVNDNLEVLDAGAGTGLYSFAILKRFPNAKITAFDLNDELLAKFRLKVKQKELSNKIEIFNGDVILPLSHNKQFDLVITGGVLEHVDLDKAVKNLSQYVKTGGYFLNAGVKNNMIGRFVGSIWRIHTFSKEKVINVFSNYNLNLEKYLLLPAKYFFMGLVKEAYIFKKLVITSKEVVDFYTQLENIGVEIWVDGGWGVDALLGKQLRPHKDLDIAIQWKDVPKLQEVLVAHGYKQVREDSQWNFVLADDKGHEIDIHAFIYGNKGNVVEGIMYPAESLTGTGVINGRSVKCISAKYMVEFLAPWIHKWPEKYLDAVSALCEKYEIELPEEYKKFINKK